MRDHICSVEQCTGCMACYNACPKHCISMYEGDMGHLYPLMESSSCIDCRLCENVCPVFHPIKTQSPLKAYAGWHQNIEEYYSSTSGGAATAIAQKVIQQKGIVYGCVAEGLQVKHIRIDTLTDIRRLKGSKYVQSYIGNTYTNVKNDLIKGIEVLFIGTPCQVAGLKSFLRKKYELLTTIDLICHGVPSQKMLRKHINKVGKGEAEFVQFRQGNDMGLRLFNKDRNMIYYSNVWIERFKDIYYSTFIDGYTYRSSCYQCPYAQTNRCSDITIGDFWGISSDFQHDSVNGLSCILPITEKGLKLVESCQLFLHERTVDEAVNGNDQLHHPCQMDARRQFFRTYYHLFGIRLTYWLCELDHIIDKIIIQRIKRKLHL